MIQEGSASTLHDSTNANGTSTVKESPPDLASETIDDSNSVNGPNSNLNTNNTNNSNNASNNVAISSARSVIASHESNGHTVGDLNENPLSDTFSSSSSSSSSFPSSTSVVAEADATILTSTQPTITTRDLSPSAAINANISSNASVTTGASITNSNATGQPKKSHSPLDKKRHTSSNINTHSTSDKTTSGNSNDEDLDKSLQNLIDLQVATQKKRANPGLNNSNSSNHSSMNVSSSHHTSNNNINNNNIHINNLNSAPSSSNSKHISSASSVSSTNTSSTSLHARGLLDGSLSGLSNEEVAELLQVLLREAGSRRIQTAHTNSLGFLNTLQHQQHHQPLHHHHVGPSEEFPMEDISTSATIGGWTQPHAYHDSSDYGDNRGSFNSDTSYYNSDTSDDEPDAQGSSDGGRKGNNVVDSGLNSNNPDSGASSSGGAGLKSSPAKKSLSKPTANDSTNDHNNSNDNNNNMRSNYRGDNRRTKSGSFYYDTIQHRRKIYPDPLNTNVVSVPTSKNSFNEKASAHGLAHSQQGVIVSNVFVDFDANHINQQQHHHKETASILVSSTDSNLSNLSINRRSSVGSDSNGSDASMLTNLTDSTASTTSLTNAHLPSNAESTAQHNTITGTGKTFVQTHSNGNVSITINSSNVATSSNKHHQVKSSVSSSSKQNISSSGSITSQSNASHSRVHRRYHEADLESDEEIASAFGMPSHNKSGSSISSNSMHHIHGAHTSPSTQLRRGKDSPLSKKKGAGTPPTASSNHNTTSSQLSKASGSASAKDKALNSKEKDNSRSNISSKAPEKESISSGALKESNIAPVMIRSGSRNSTDATRSHVDSSSITGFRDASGALAPAPSHGTSASTPSPFDVSIALGMVHHQTFQSSVGTLAGTAAGAAAGSIGGVGNSSSYLGGSDASTGISDKRTHQTPPLSSHSGHFSAPPPIVPGLNLSQLNSNINADGNAGEPNSSNRSTSPAFLMKPTNISRSSSLSELQQELNNASVVSSPGGNAPLSSRSNGSVNSNILDDLNLTKNASWLNRSIINISANCAFDEVSVTSFTSSRSSVSTLSNSSELFRRSNSISNGGMQSNSNSNNTIKPVLNASNSVNASTYNPNLDEGEFQQKLDSSAPANSSASASTLNCSNNSNNNAPTSSSSNIPPSSAAVNTAVAAVAASGSTLASANASNVTTSSGSVATPASVNPASTPSSSSSSTSTSVSGAGKSGLLSGHSSHSNKKPASKR